MRILSIQGRNIRSLYKDFKIDFENPPFYQSALFAITGPTGAGKSTLLDVVCLALYGTCPRVQLQTSKSAKIEDISASDARTAVSRGASEALAEVLFECNGNRYRALWRVHRAGKKKAGAFQRPIRELIHVGENKTIADQSKSVDAKIESITGLNFVQFSRSVLLAQGDFAAFLKAPADERAKLLETITGMNVYSLLSIRAHERGKEIEYKIQQLESDRARISLLSEQEFLALEAEIHRDSDRAEKLSQTESLIQKNIVWHQQYKQLEKNLHQAINQHEHAETKYSMAVDDRILLEKAKKALSIRSELELVTRLSESLQKAKTALNNSQKRKEYTFAEFTAAKDALNNALKQYEDEKQKQELLQPEIETARSLDIQIQSAQKYFNEKKKTLAEIQTQLKKCRSDLNSFIIQEENLIASIEKERQWLDRNHNIDKIASDWLLMDSLLKQLENEIKKMKTYADAENQHKIDLNRLKEQHDQLKIEAESILKQRSEIYEKLTGLKNQLTNHQEKYPYSVIQKNFSILSQGLNVCSYIIGLYEKNSELSKQIQAFQANSDRLAMDLKNLDADLDKDIKEQESLRVRIDEARRSLDLIRMTLSCEQLRSKLKPGVPCMVCGSTDHPYLKGLTPEKSLQIQEEQRIADLQNKFDALEKNISECRSQKARIEENIKTLNARCLETDEIIIKNQNDITENECRFYQIISKDLEQKEKGISAWRNIITQLESQKQDVENALNLQNELSQQIHKISFKFDEFQKKEQEIQSRLAEIIQEKSLKQNELNLILQRKKESAEIQEELLNQMTPAFHPISSTWEHECKTNTSAFRKEYEKRVAEFKQHQDLLSKHSLSIADLKPVLSEFKSRAADLQARLSVSENEVEQASQDNNNLISQRKKLLNGKLVEVIEKEIKKQSELIENKLNICRKSEKETELRFREAEAILNQAISNLTASENDYNIAYEALQQVLVKTDIKESEARNLNAKGANFIKDIEKKLSDVETELARAKEHLHNRQNDLDVFKNSTQIPNQSEQDLKIQQAEIVEEKKKIDEAMKLLFYKKHEAEIHRKESYRLQSELDATLNQGKCWQKLDEVIGHHSGTKFRKFAQQITLKHLVDLSNLQLASLSPRYQLTQLESENLDIAVIDRDQASELRQISTLSGGEMFLVSLALALALSSLAGRQAQIQTLFIDEGFGALDPDTLDTAIATLEVIQSHGKTIGLISHLPALQERIGCQVRVIPQGAGRSRLEVRDMFL